MRKFPKYGLIQELTMQGMMILLIIGYIGYDFMEEWGFYSYIMMAICGTGIVLLFRQQITSMRMAKIVSIVTDKNDFNVKKNYIFAGVVNLLIFFFSGLHFYLYHKAGKSFDPLYSEYGIGALLGVGLWVYDLSNNQVVITEQGVAFGSKLRPTLLTWSVVDKATNEKGKVTVIPKSTFGIKSIEVQGIRVTQQLSTLLRMHNKMK